MIFDFFYASLVLRGGGERDTELEYLLFLAAGGGLSGDELYPRRRGALSRGSFRSACLRRGSGLASRRRGGGDGDLDGSGEERRRRPAGERDLDTELDGLRLRRLTGGEREGSSENVRFLRGSGDIEGSEENVRFLRGSGEIEGSEEYVLFLRGSGEIEGSEEYVRVRGAGDRDRESLGKREERLRPRFFLGAGDLLREDERPLESEEYRLRRTGVLGREREE